MRIDTVGGKKFVTVKQRGKTMTRPPEAAIAEASAEISELADVVAGLTAQAAIVGDRIKQQAISGECTRDARAELTRINQEISNAQFSARLTQQTVVDIRRAMNDTSAEPILTAARERIAATLAPFNIRRLTAHV